MHSHMHEQGKRGAPEFAPRSFLATLHCDSCGSLRGERALSVRRHSVYIDGRYVVPANGPTPCPHCTARATFRRLPELPGEAERPDARAPEFRIDPEEVA